MNNFAATALSILALSAGCGLDDPGDGADPDEPGESDDLDDDLDDDFEEPPEPTAPCTLSGAIEMGGNHEGFVSADGVFYANSTADFDRWLEIGLFSGEGPFASGIVTGTFPFESDLETCAVCGDYWVAESPGSEAGYTLAATSGTLEVTEVSTTAGSAFRGTISGATFVEYGDQGPVEGGCSMTLSQASFDVTLMAETGEM